MRTRRQRAAAPSPSPSPLKRTKKQILESKQKKKGKRVDPVAEKKVKKVDNEVKSPKKSMDNTKKLSTARSQKSNERKGKKQKTPTPQKKLRKSKIQEKPLSKSKVSKAQVKGKQVKEKQIKEKQAKNKQDKKVSKEQKKPKQKLQTTNDQKKKDDNEKIQKVIIKGVAPIDPHYNGPSNVHVLFHGNKIYNATLNQTNTSNNNNKYYIIQVLQSDGNSNTCYLFTRWGRVGFQGQQSLLGPYTIDIAIRQYQKKFNDKHRKGDYRVVDICYDDQDDAPTKQAGQQANKQIDPNKKKNDFEESKLQKPVKSLMQLIFDMNMMNKHMVEIGYNVKKMPLGKLSKNSILKGYQILKDLLNQIEHNNKKQTVQSLTDEFYSIIPHDFKFQKMSNFVLNTASKVKEKLQMLQALGQIKIAANIINDGSTGNKIDQNYAKLQRDIKHIEKGSVQYKLIEDYLLTTHASTHSYYKLQLVDLFQINDERQNIRFTKDIHNKMLLWHGSRLTNFVGILSQGLRIAPPQAPVSGYMFGKGVYFADMSSKSANYCFTSRQNNTGILLLCQVGLGTMNQKYHADYYASNLPPNKHSTLGLGRTAPPKQKYQTFKDMIIPMGPGQATNLAGCTLMYNEYIVYDIAQIRIKYLLRTKFKYS